MTKNTKIMAMLLLASVLAFGFVMVSDAEQDDAATEVSTLGDLNEAMIASGTSEIKITGNISWGYGYVQVNGVKTLDLNGYTIGATNPTKAGGINVRADAELTIVDSSTSGTGLLKSAVQALNVSSGSSCTMNSGKIMSTYDLAVVVGGTSKTDYQLAKATFVMNGGTIESEDCGIFMQQNTDVTINGGTIISKDNANLMPNGTTRSTSESTKNYYGNNNVTITGGEFIATIKEGYGGGKTFGAFNLFICQSGVWNITGGSFYAYDTTARTETGFENYTGGAVNFVVRGGQATFDFDNIVVKQVYRDSTNTYRYGDSSFLSTSGFLEAYYSAGSYGYVTDKTNYPLAITDPWVKYTINGTSYEVTPTGHTTPAESAVVCYKANIDDVYYETLDAAKQEWVSGEYIRVITNNGTPLDISNATVTIPDAAYDGKEHTPSTVYMTIGGYDYIMDFGQDVTVENNAFTQTDAGTYTATLTGYGNYSGSVSATFKIVDTSTQSNTVTFISEGNIYSTATVEPGSIVIKPTEPIRSGYRFTGWYTTSECETKYDFTTAVTGSFSLYAGWSGKATVSVPSTGTGYTITDSSGQALTTDTDVTMGSTYTFVVAADGEYSVTEVYADYTLLGTDAGTYSFTVTGNTALSVTVTLSGSTISTTEDVIENDDGTTTKTTTTITETATGSKTLSESAQTTDSSGTATETSTTTVEMSSTTATMTISSNNESVTTVTSTIIEAITEATGTDIIDLAVTATTPEIAIPKTALNNDNIASITVEVNANSSNTATITLPKSILADSSMSDVITLSVTDSAAKAAAGTLKGSASNSFDLSIGGTATTEFDGLVDISYEIELPNMAKNVRAYCFDTNEYVKASYSRGIVDFSVGHFSSWAIVYDVPQVVEEEDDIFFILEQQKKAQEAASSQTTSEDNSGEEAAVIIAAAAVAGAMLACAFFAFRKS